MPLMESPMDALRIKASPKPKPEAPEIRRKMAERIQKLRVHKGLSQLDIAMKMGLSDATISMWEQAKTEPSLEKIQFLAEILSTTPEYLAFGVVYH